MHTEKYKENPLLRNLLKPLAFRLSQTRYGRRALDERADLSVFKNRPSSRLIMGVGLIIIGQIMGLPAVAGFSVAAAWMKEPIVLLGGPIAYGVSWGIWALGMWVAGPDNIMYVNALGKWAVRRSIEGILGETLIDNNDQAGEG